MPKSRRRPGRDGPRKAAQAAPKREESRKDGDVTPDAVDSRSPGKGMDRRSRDVVIGLMCSMLILFLVIAWMAPDTTQADARPSKETIWARVILLLSLLGVTYGLLMWDRIIKVFRRIWPRSEP
ncbi:MAG: hypothetical protein ACUVXD_09280 [Thermodesulfobacteriota bacterium]